MNRDVMQALERAEGRYISPEDQALLLDCAAHLPRALEAMRELEEAEEAIVEATVDALTAAHPDLTDAFIDGREKLVHDLRLTLRYCALSMVRKEASFLDEALLRWFAPLLRGVMSEETIDELFTRFASHLERRCSEETFALVSPYIDQITLAFAEE